MRSARDDIGHWLRAPTTADASGVGRTTAGRRVAARTWPVGWRARVGNRLRTGGLGPGPTFSSLGLALFQQGSKRS